jgi:glycosyltransferase involved in cell wall biosynthesis
MENKKHHILFLPAWYPHRYDAMEGLFVQNHAKATAPYERITVLHAVAIDTDHPFPTLEINKENGFPEITVYYQKVHSRIPLISQYKKYKRWKEALQKGINYAVMHYGQPDFIHNHILTRYGIVALFLSKKWHISYGITEHWSRYLSSRRHRDYRGIFRRLLTRRIVRRAKFVLPVTQNLQKAMQEVGLKNTNYTVVPNVVDTSLFRPSATTPPKQPFRFLHVSCMDNRAKNITGLLDAVKQLSQSFQDFSLTLVGDGPDLTMIQEYANSLNIDKFIRFTGLLTDHNLVSEFQAGHCLVLFSHYENMPVVINESFACGLPVIATAVGGIPEIVTPERGILVAPNDTQALRKAMLEMITHYEHYDKTKLRQYAETYFSYSVVGKQLSALYRKYL